MASPRRKSLATRRGAQFLAAAIESVLAKTYPDFELVIVIDGATDASHRIAASYPDPRIRILVNETNQGLAKSLNRGLKIITSVDEEVLPIDLVGFNVTSASTAVDRWTKRKRQDIRERLVA